MRILPSRRAAAMTPCLGSDSHRSRPMLRVLRSTGEHELRQSRFSSGTTSFTTAVPTRTGLFPVTASCTLALIRRGTFRCWSPSPPSRQRRCAQRRQGAGMFAVSAGGPKTSSLRRCEGASSAAAGGPRTLSSRPAPLFERQRSVRNRPAAACITCNGSAIGPAIHGRVRERVFCASAGGAGATSRATGSQTVFLFDVRCFRHPSSVSWCRTSSNRGFTKSAHGRVRTQAVASVWFGVVAIGGPVVTFRAQLFPSKGRPPA